MFFQKKKYSLFKDYNKKIESFVDSDSTDPEPKCNMNDENECDGVVLCPSSEWGVCPPYSKRVGMFCEPCVEEDLLLVPVYEIEKCDKDVNNMYGLVSY